MAKPPAWITPAAIDRLHTPGARVFARTRYFPDIERLLEGLAWESFDEIYDVAPSLEEVNRAIAERLIISPSTADFHVSNILGKLGVSSRTEAVALAVQHHIVD